MSGSAELLVLMDNRRNYTRNKHVFQGPENIDHHLRGAGAYCGGPTTGRAAQLVYFVFVLCFKITYAASKFCDKGSMYA